MWLYKAANWKLHDFFTIICIYGRVIRTETDKGRVLLIDDRYINNKYSVLLPNEWYPINKY
ncbi:helicase C-terminal domain-containing protein [Clostridium beijerinckii]|uniref:helicase C-terminal domain-containing protein n=1 Tax=Clostridium beijerinckii TaxID=1520 RepID=UPI003BFA66C3